MDYTIAEELSLSALHGVGGSVTVLSGGAEREEERASASEREE